MASKRPVQLVQSEVWLGRTEFEDLIRQREPETAGAPQYTGTRSKAIEVRPRAGRPSRVSSVAPLFSPVPALAADEGLIRLDGLEPAQASDRPSAARPSRRGPRWAAVGLVGLAIAGSAVSVLLLTSPGEVAKGTARNAAPVQSVPIIPPSSPGNDRGSEPIEAGQTVAGAPKPAEEVAVRSAPASVPGSHTARSERSETRTAASPEQHPAPAPTMPPAGQAALDEAYNWWSQAATYGAKNPRWAHLSPESPSR